MGFNWLFAIIAGGFFLFMAIWFASQIVDTGSEIVNTESASEFLTLLDPLSAGLASGSSGVFDLRKETRIYLECSNEENEPFGKLKVRFAEKQFEKWSVPSSPVSTPDKYIFSDNVIEGKHFDVFSLSLDMPFKVADLIFLTNDSYCFYGVVPNGVKEEIESVGFKKINFTSNVNCKGTKVCFGSTNCPSDAKVKVLPATCSGTICEYDNYQMGTVTDSRNGTALEKKYYGPLLFGAIFSSKANYDCNVARLMKRYGYIMDLYESKLNICGGNDNLVTDFNRIREIISPETEIDYSNLAESIYNVELKNKQTRCSIY